MKAFVLLLFAALVSCSPAAEKHERVELVVNADDVGAHPLFTDSSIEAAIAGDVGSLSVLAPGKDAERALSKLSRHPEIAVGVHLTLTGEGVAVLPAAAVPGLYNEHGSMWGSLEDALAHAAVEEAAAEWEAQIRKVVDAGVNVTHLDAHMGCYFANRALFRAALELAKQYRVVLIAPYIPAFANREERELFRVVTYQGVYELPGGETESLESRADAYRRLLGGLSEGTHYIFTHLAAPGADPRGFNDLEIRENDYRFWTGERSAELTAQNEIRLISAVQLQEEFLATLDARGR